MDQFILSILSGLISGLVASIIFYWYMSSMRPKIIICDGIAKDLDSEGRAYYAFKIYNNSSKFDLLDINIEVHLKSPFNTDGGQNFRLHKINLVKDNVMLLPKCSSKTETEGSYALIVTTRDDLDALWSADSQHVELYVQAKHSFSGATKSYSKKYYRKSTSISNGMFTFGKTNAIR